MLYLFVAAPYDRRMRRILLAVAVCCWASTLQAKPAITRIALERTPCYGTCPVYTLTIHRSGRVEFFGKEHVRAKGLRSGRISSADFATLVRKIDAIDFFNMRARYDGRNPDGSGTTITDQPTRKTSVTRGGRTKTVENYFRGPPALKELEDLIDELAKSAKWIRG